MMASPDAPLWFARQPFKALGLLLLMAAHFLLAVDIARTKTPTIDEVAHLPAGQSYWQTRTFKMYRQSPPLGRMIPAAALLSDPLQLDYGCVPWNSVPASHFGFAYNTLALHIGTQEEATKYLQAFTRARVAVAACSALTIPLLFAWGCWWFSARSGWLAAILWTVSPNILGHASLATTDLLAASGWLLACYTFARWLDSPSKARLLAAGLALGLAQGVKFTCLLLYPCLLLWWGLARRWRRDVEGPKPGALAFGAIVAISLLLINSLYLFEGTGTQLGEYRFGSSMLSRPGPMAAPGVRARPVNRFRDTWLHHLPVPLPYHFVAGFDDQKRESESSPGMYLWGERTGGAGARREGTKSWRHYYLLALWFKVPAGTWVLLAASMAGLFVGPQAFRTRRWGLFALALVPIVGISLLNHIHIGLRYVLPAFPFLFLLAGSVAELVAGRKARWLVAALVVWNVVSLSRSHPHELSYFQDLVGGPSRGRFYLADSNLDWGQDLRGLARWLARNPEWQSEVRLAYKGTVPPDLEGIAAHRLAPRDLRFVPPQGLLPWENPSDPTTYGPQPGKFAVSSDFERGLGLYTPTPLVPEGEGNQRAWQRPGAETPIVLYVPADVYRYFENFEPRIVPEIGPSILLYDLSREEVDRVRRKLGLAPLP